MELTANQINAVEFVMVDATDTELTGLTVAVSVSKNGAAFAAGSGTASEIGSGWYRYVLPAAECPPGVIAVKVTAGGARQQNLVYAVAVATSGVIPSPPAGAIAFDYTLTNSVTSAPVAGASVWATTDIAGLYVVATGVTDSNGVVVLYLQPGTYQFWASKSPDFDQSGPDEEIVS